MSKEDWRENTVKNIFEREGLWPWKDDEIVSVLDAACGLSLKSKYIPAQIRVGVDIHEKYFEFIESEVPYVTVKYDIRKLEEIFMPKSFDIVIALDVVEHLEKEESLDLLRQCEKIARKAVIIETPRGYVPQNMDIQGHGADEWQTHRCGWEVEEFQNLGYKTVVRKYAMQDVKRHTEIEDIDPNIELIDAIKYV